MFFSRLGILVNFQLKHPSTQILQNFVRESSVMESFLKTRIGGSNLRKLWGGGGGVNISNLQGP